MLRIKYAISLFLGTVLAVNVLPAENAKAIPLFNMPCIGNPTLKNESVFVARRPPINIPIGREFVSEIAFMGITTISNNIRLFPADPVEVVCRLNSKFNNLNLAFGLDSRESNDSTRLQIAIFVDGNLVVTRPVTKGPVNSLSVNVINAQNVSIAVECKQSVSCPRLSFVDMTLKRI